MLSKPSLTWLAHAVNGTTRQDTFTLADSGFMVGRVTLDPDPDGQPAWRWSIMGGDREHAEAAGGEADDQAGAMRAAEAAYLTLVETQPSRRDRFIRSARHTTFSTRVSFGEQTG